ncbi:MAG: hypothetical protein KF710_08580 [Rhodocyclaceae bacterium]|nr:hypothetical protein [Rhodocyclaceae bacterium]
MENPPDPRPDVPEALLQQRMLALHARLATSVLPFSAVISSLIWFFYRNDIQPWWTLPTWWSLNNLVSLWRLRQFRQYAASPERRSVREWSRRFITGAALAGGIWGASGLLLYTPDNIALQTILPLILMGVAASGMVSLTSLLPAYLWFFGLMLLPNVIAFALRNTFTDQLVALALALFVVSLIFNGKRVAGVSRANNLLQLQLSRALEEANSARHAAEQASEAKSRFLATMSHEIRTPMNGVLGMCQLLTLTPLDSSQREYLRTLENSGQHLLGLIDDVLDFSRIEAGRMELDIQAFSPRELLEDLATLMFPRGRAKGLDCRLEITGELSPTLAGDAGRIRQVLLNLIGNAIKFTGSGSVTLIASETEGATPGLRVLKLVVNDTGIGISGQDQDRIFDAFTQADNSHARRFGGSGLGLAIVRELTSLLGGTIHVDSAPGKGSRFTLDLPCRSAPANRRAPPPTHPQWLRTARRGQPHQPARRQQLPEPPGADMRGRGQWRAGTRDAIGPLPRGTHGLRSARHGRIRSDAPLAGAGAGGRHTSGTDHRAHGRRRDRNARALPRRRHERLPHQTLPLRPACGLPAQCTRPYSLKRHGHARTQRDCAAASAGIGHNADHELRPLYQGTRSRRQGCPLLVDRSGRNTVW